LTGPIAITGTEPGNPGVVGTLHSVALDGSLSDPLGLTSGNVSFVANDVVLVRLSLAAGSTSVEALGIGVNSTPLFGNPVGAGAYADAAQAPSAASANGALLLAQFDFSPDTLDADESSVRLLVTYGPEGSALGVGHRTINFMIKSGTNFTVVGTLIPEPEGIVLVALGVVCMALRARHARYRTLCGR